MPRGAAGEDEDVFYSLDQSAPVLDDDDDEDLDDLTFGQSGPPST